MFDILAILDIVGILYIISEIFCDIVYQICWYSGDIAYQILDIVRYCIPNIYTWNIDLNMQQDNVWNVHLWFLHKNPAYLPIEKMIILFVLEPMVCTLCFCSICKMEEHVQQKNHKMYFYVATCCQNNYRLSTWAINSHKWQYHLLLLIQL